MKNDFGKNFEKKFSKYAIPNLSLYLVICYAFSFLLERVNNGVLDYLSLEPIKIMGGEIWRLITWIIIPLATEDLIYLLISLVLFYNIGRSLEEVWGKYRYNVYLISGFLFTVIGCLLVFVVYIVLGKGYIIFGNNINSYYTCMSVFFAFSVMFPERKLYLMYVIPVKVKYIGVICGIYLVLKCLLGGIINWVVIGSSLLNFLVFFFTSRKRIRMSPKQMKQRQQFRSQVHRATKITRHKCAICGRTEETNPELEFRFCSKCNGNFEYCQDHLFTHKHVE